jgi:hypothetical protein
MNVLDMEADMVKLTLCVWPRGYARLARDHQHTYEPIVSRAPPKALASPARGAPHTDELGLLEPERAESDSYVYGHLKSLMMEAIRCS